MESKKSKSCQGILSVVENAIRLIAIGNKNWLFIGEADACQTSAILFLAPRKAGGSLGRRSTNPRTASSRGFCSGTSVPISD